MELLYFTDVSQLDYVRLSNPSMLKHMLPITGNMVVAFEMEKLGIDFIDEWSFLTPEDVENNWNTAYSLSRRWWDECQVNVECEGFSLPDATQQDMVYSLEASLNARTIFSRLFDNYSINRISGYFLPSVGVIRTGPVPTNRAVSSVTQAVLFYIAERRGVTVERLVSDLPLTQGSVSKKSVWASLCALQDIEEAKFRDNHNLNDKIIVIYEAAMPINEHAALMKVLGKLSGVRVISISQNILEQASQFNITRSNVGNRLLLFWNKFIESVENYQGDYPEIFANNHMLFQFERIKNEMEFASVYGDIFNIFLEQLKPSLVIFAHEAFTIERVLVRTARSRNIPTASLIHGGVRFKCGSRGIVGDADIALVWNDSDVEWLTSFGVAGSRINKTGSLRYESSYDKYVNQSGNNSIEKKKIAKKRLGVDLDKPLIVLVTAEVNTGLSAPIADAYQHRVAIREFFSFIESRPDLQFIIKAHPTYDYHELYRRLLKFKLPNFMFLENKTLSEVLEASDICLMINYCTTASLEAMFYRVPVIYLNTAIYPLPDWQDNLSENHIHRVVTFVDMEKHIDSILTDPEAKRKALLDANTEIRKLLGINQFSASRQLLKILEILIENDRSKENYNETLSMDVTQACLCDEFPISHNITGLMYVSAYLAGFNGHEEVCLYQIFQKFNIYNKDEIAWVDLRWILYQAFILGNINYAVQYKANRSIIFLLLKSCMFNPHKLMLAPLSFKKSILIYLTRIFVSYFKLCKTFFKFKNNV